MRRSFREEMAAIDEIADCHRRLVTWRERAVRQGGKLSVRMTQETAEELAALVAKYGGHEGHRAEGRKVSA